MSRFHHSASRLCLFLSLGIIMGCTQGTPAVHESGATSSGIASEISIFGASVSPSSLEDSDTASVELGVKFRSSVPGAVTGIRFYKGSAANAGMHVGSLWTRAGQRLASATFTHETATGWQTVRFASPVSIAAHTTYVASYLSPRGRYSATVGYFAGQDATNGSLTALASGVDGQNGVYVYGSGGFPTQSYQSTNYFVDVLFLPTPDTSAPSAPGSLVATASAPGSIQLTWGAATDDAGVTAYLISRDGNEVASVPGTERGYKDLGLAASTLYRYTVKARDAAGNISAASNTASATTSAQQPPDGLNLPRVPWEGGPAFYARFPSMAGTPWLSEDFFPIGYWGAYTDEERRIATDKAHGINTFLETYAGNDSSAGWMRKYGIWNLAGSGLGGEAVGTTFYDETDMWAGPGWDPWTGNVATYTDGNIGGEAPNWFGIPANEVRRAANYGEILMTKLRSASGAGNNGEPRIPLGVIVELGGQAQGSVITANQVEGAVWSTLIHEARMLGYFSHVFSDSTANPFTTDVLNDSRAEYQATRERVKKINAEVTALARVLNTQSYVWQFNPSLSTMLKYRDGAAYVFAMQKRQFTSGTYTFTLPAELPASGTLEVLGENRSISYSGGRFTDSFTAEYTHHSYRIPD